MENKQTYCDKLETEINEIKDKLEVEEELHQKLQIAHKETLSRSEIEQAQLQDTIDRLKDSLSS